MPIVIRPASAADQPQITALVRAAPLIPIGLSWRNFLIAERQDASSAQIVATGQLRPHRDGVVELASLLVVPEEQGKGIGSRLVNALIRKADRPLYLMCEQGKVAYYQRFGFTELTHAAVMPRTFRRIYRLATVVQRVAGIFTQKMPRVAIMAHAGIPAPSESQAVNNPATV